MPKVTAEKILLGSGIVTVGTTPIGLTRGGSSFTVEREIRQIEADGDRGPVKGRVVIDTEVAKLVVNALEIFNAEDMTKYYPALSLSASNVLTGTLSIAAGDYNDVTWVGKTKDGKAVTIKVENALNLSNLEWTLEDKNEVVPSLEFTGTYDEATRNTPPWSVTFETGDSHSVTIVVTSNGSTPIEGAIVTLYGQTATSNASGEATFPSIPEGTNREFTVVKGGYATYFGAIDIDGVETETITMTELA
ncbi:MAG: carboxypeptidase-like regulatory domain-containing protein [Peptococcia bacterium]|jgi:hypothetical protein